MEQGKCASTATNSSVRCRTEVSLPWLRAVTLCMAAHPKSPHPRSVKGFRHRTSLWSSHFNPQLHNGLPARAFMPLTCSTLHAASCFDSTTKLNSMGPRYCTARCDLQLEREWVRQPLTGSTTDT